MIYENPVYRQFLFVRLMFEMESRDMITDYSVFYSGLAMDDSDRKKIKRGLGDRYELFMAYRRELFRLSYKTLKVSYKMGLNKAKLYLINNPWKISILEGFERNMPEGMIAAVKNIPKPK